MYLTRALFFILCLATTSGQTAEPELSLSRDSFDFGLVPPKSVLEHRLVCTAGAEDSLRITRIKTGCACIAASVDSLTIPPGDSAEIWLTWDLRHLRGALTKTLYLFTARSDDPYKFNMTAFGSYSDSSESPLAVVQPQDIRLRQAAVGSAFSALATVRNLTGEQCEIKLVELSNGRMTLSYPESLEAGATGQIRFSLPSESADQPTGEATGGEATSGEAKRGKTTADAVTFEISSEDRILRLTLPISSGSSSGSLLTNNRK